MRRIASPPWWLLGTCVLALGCSAIGDPGSMPDGLPHGGTGQFRLLDSEETGIVGSLPGRAMALRGIAIESAMRGGDFLFYTHQAQIDEPPTPPPTHGADEIYRPAFEPRSIHRGGLREEGTGAFDSGPEVLAASASWEDGEVFDPWVFVDDDGTALLYYAGRGGIGVAIAPAVDGSFARQPGPIVGPDADGLVPRRPSVIRGPDDALWMYFDDGRDIGVARSEDGVRFDVMEGLTIEGSDETESIEARRANPGAVRVETRADRVLVRVYFESRRLDGTRFAYVMGSEDGLTFTRFPRPAMPQADVRFPAPYLVDDVVTFLYSNFPFVSVGYQTRAVTVAVAPAGTDFRPPDETM